LFATVALMSEESARLDATRRGEAAWRKWGPYLSERQWGTVREDYGQSPNSWSYFPHDHARSRAYRWGEDGLLGLCDDRQHICFALALHNGEDPILKERLFGLTNGEGNHGEDVKELYYYLDSTPTHSYMKALYKYPQRAYPYMELIRKNAERDRQTPEFELIDTGIFDDDRYFDVFVEYAKESPNHILIEITAWNRGPEPASLRLLPTLWFRNTWSWGGGHARPHLQAGPSRGEVGVVSIHHPDLGHLELLCDGAPDLLFTENETNARRLFAADNPTPFVKDGVHEYVVFQNTGAVNPGRFGTKVAADYPLRIEPGASRSVRLRLHFEHERTPCEFGPAFCEVMDTRRREADAFYAEIVPQPCTPDEGRVMRQALAGMLWTKQYYEFHVAPWLSDRGHRHGDRNATWVDLRAHDVISMPDKWEYPWFAVWDAAFHVLPLALVDIDFAKHQLALFVGSRYMKKDGEMPAYEWNFGDVNPPVHAFATINIYDFERRRRGGQGDFYFLKHMFDRLRRNFEWWTRQRDLGGRDLFSGGFLGLDNIGVFDRSQALPTGGTLTQSDASAWMLLYAQAMLRIALELCTHDSAYEEQAAYFLDRTLAIANATDALGHHADELWDEDDGFFYDVLRFPDGSATRLKVRSLVGLLLVAASTVIQPYLLDRLPRFRARLERCAAGSDVTRIHCPIKPGTHGRRLLAALDDRKLRRLLATMLDENEFLSPFGVRSLSRVHRDDPYRFHWGGQTHTVGYVPGDSDSAMFGGNSNWRGPVWMPVNYLLIRALLTLYAYYGEDFRVECPTGSGCMMTLYEVAIELSGRVASIFLRDGSGARPMYGRTAKFNADPHFRDHLLFYEYFHGDDGRGIGANHQTGWTGCVASVINLIHRLSESEAREHAR